MWSFHPFIQDALGSCAIASAVTKQLKPGRCDDDDYKVALFSGKSHCLN